MGSDRIILFHTCTSCRQLYGTTPKSGPHECPLCGHVDRLLFMAGTAHRNIGPLSPRTARRLN